MPYKPIQCAHYDHIEIACMRSYLLDITLQSGKIISNARARDTHIVNHEEFLIVDVNDEQQEIRLDKIKTITVLDNANDKETKFKTIKISS
ncbi:MAG TPA: hypothetical protein EYH16_02345 [Leucothrix mucor]|nr:hypothetical protein [Leucothrix mucor]